MSRTYASLKHPNSNLSESEKSAHGQATGAEVNPSPPEQAHPHHHHHMSEMLPESIVHPHRHHHVPHGIHPDGESGRQWLTIHFFRIVARSSCWPSALVNILWPFVPVAIGLYFGFRNSADPTMHTAIFATNYIAMVPAANLLGFAGQELARKLPKVFGVILETFLGGIVEIILFAALIVEAREDSSKVAVIQAAIIGSVLANLLFCLGLCFVAGGMRHASQKFEGEISETGSGLLLMVAFALAVPRSFAFSLESDIAVSDLTRDGLVTQISRVAAILLMIAYIIYVVFQMASHHSIISTIYEEDEARDLDREDDMAKDKLTLTECIVAIVLALAFVSMHAVFLVEEIDHIVDYNGVSDMFLGLILVPLVEKFSEHLTAIDEAWDNTMNLALAHVLGATLQTAMLNTSLVVLIGWGIGVNMNLDFAPYHVIILVLGILAVGSFLRDGESNYLEGSLCILIYLLIAVTAYYYPNENEAEVLGSADSMGETPASDNATTTAVLETATSMAVEAARRAVSTMMRA